MNLTSNNFFGSANTGTGFVNYLNEIMSETSRHYIIKGGPGTGKSYLMRAFAREGEKRGLNVECIFCSSDPDSIDAVIIKELDIGISDGTAPHIAEPVYPGVTHRIINLGDFWNDGILSSSRKRIIELTDLKGELYKNVYLHLNAALCYDNISACALQKCLLKEKADKAICRIINKTSNSKGKEKIRLVEGITMNGYITLAPYLNEAAEVYNIHDSYNISHFIFDAIYSHLKGSEMILSYDPLNTRKINMIYLPKDRILFCKNTTNEAKQINAERFVDKDQYKRNRLLIKNAVKGKAQGLREGLLLLEDIKRVHFELEDIYKDAMNFNEKEKYQNQLLKEIFS